MSKSGQKSEHYRWRNGGNTLPTVSGRVGTRPPPPATDCSLRLNKHDTSEWRTYVQPSYSSAELDDDIGPPTPHTVEGLSELRVGPGGSLLSCNFPRSPRTPKWASAPSLTTMKPYFFCLSLSHNTTGTLVQLYPSTTYQYCGTGLSNTIYSIYMFR